jgi:DNA-binding MltR family transcriptional regulator
VGNQDLDISDYHHVVEMFHSESDRGAAVLAGSFAEHFLVTYLRSLMVNADSGDDLFHGFGPFANFSQRIETAYAFGFLTARTRKDLDYIRRIRNHFAHHPREADFEKSPVRELVDNLTFPERVETQGPGEDIVYDRRTRYLLSISLGVVEMQNAMIRNGMEKERIKEGT